MKHLTVLGSALALSVIAAAPAGAVECDPTNGDCYGVWATSGLSGYHGSEGGGNVTSASFSYDASADWANTYGYASGDLATGAMHAYATSSYWAGSVSVQLYERFGFDLPDGVTSLEVPVTWTIEGTTNFITGFPNGFWAYFGISGWDMMGSSDHDTVEFNDFHFYSDSPNPPAIWENGIHSYTFTDMLTISEDWLYQLDTYISLGFNGGGTLDYGNTSFFNIELPEDVKLLSSSNVLLSTPYQPATGAVPEPATWAMMILGFGAVGGVMRSRRRAVAGGALAGA